MQSTDVCIHGSGAVAHCLALALSRQGLAVALAARPGFELVDRTDVRTYALNAASRSLLQQLKVWEALPPDAVTPVHDMQVSGDDAGARLSFSAWQQGVEALAWIVDAAELDQALHLAASFAPHITAVPVPVPASLQVLAEGRDSAARQDLGVRFERLAYQHSAVAARLVADRPHHGVARQWFRSPDVLALLPFDKPCAGASYGLVWSLPQARAHDLMQASAAEFEAALAQATGQACGSLSLQGSRAAWSLATAQAVPTCGPGWVLVGDAAHVVHPLSGQGLNLGLGDVAALASVVAQKEAWRGLGDVRLLRRYARQRQAPAWLMAQMTDGLQQLFSHPSGIAQAVRRKGMSLVDHVAPLKRFLANQAMR